MWRSLTVLTLLLSFIAISLENAFYDPYFDIVQEMPGARHSFQISDTYTNDVDRSSYSNYPGQRTPYLYPYPGTPVFSPDSFSPADQRAWYPYILVKEKKKQKEKKEKEKEQQKAKDPPAAAPAEKEKIPDYGLAPRVALLIAFVVLIIGVLTYDAFDKITGLGREDKVALTGDERSASNDSLRRLLSLDSFVNIIESIDVAEVAFEALSIREEECKQLAICNLRKVLNVFPQMEKFMNVLGYNSTMSKTYLKGNRAGIDRKTCKTAFPQCKYEISLK